MYSSPSRNRQAAKPTGARPSGGKKETSAATAQNESPGESSSRLDSADTVDGRIPEERSLRTAAGRSTRKTDEDNMGLVIAGVALLTVITGIAIAIYSNLSGTLIDATRPYYVSFEGVSIVSARGEMKISFDLAVPQTHAEFVRQNKNGIEVQLRSTLSSLDPNDYYSRANKEWLATHIKSIANRQLGGEVIDAVYFGSFQIFEH